MNSVNNYKITQLMHFFFTKFNYKTVIISEFSETEIWLVNPQNPTYQIIRVSINSIEQVIYEKERINNAIEMLANRLRLKEYHFLDIHIGHDEILDNELYDSLAIDDNYYDGIDVAYAYPGIKKAVHEVANPDAEIKYLLNDMNETAKNAIKQKRKIKKIPMPVTYVTMALCIINFLISLYLQSRYDSASAMIFLGADYKTFTLGLGQFWRFVTYAFVHGSFFHLFVNMYSLYYLGSLLEDQMGSLKYAAVLFLSIIGGGLLNGIFSDNTIIVGISGGLYGLMALYLILAYRGGYLNQGAIIQIIAINLFINLMGGVAIFCHLGGLIVGIITYLCFFDIKIRRKFAAILLAIFFLAGSIRYVLNPVIRPVYGGTDAEVVSIYADMGLRNYAQDLMGRLYEVYARN